jgi:hypothetical protein
MTLTAAPRNADYWQLLPVPTDSSGRMVISDSAIAHGPMNSVMLHVRGSRAQQKDLAIINDAEHAKRDLQAMREEKRAINARADAVTQAEDLIRQLVSKVDDLEARIDEFEEEKRAKAEAEEQAAASAAEYALPPGVADEDPMQTQRTHHTPGLDT